MLDQLPCTILQIIQLLQTAALHSPDQFKQELEAALEQFINDNARSRPLAEVLDKCKAYYVQQVTLESRNKWTKHVREQLSLGGGKLFKYISSEEKSFLNISLSDFPQYENSPQAFLDSQTNTWAQYWTATELQDSTRAAFEQLRFQAMTQPPSE